VRNRSARPMLGSFLLVFAVLATGCGGDGDDGRSRRPQAFDSGPRAVLGKPFGAYLTIEGVRAERGMVGPRDMIVDTIDGERLAKPVHVNVRNAVLPAGQRCVLKGYESGEMIGLPPAVDEAAKELGLEARPMQAGWQWFPQFVVLIAVEPKDLEIEGTAHWFRRPEASDKAE
jgi:hypothetical protein